MKSQGHVHKHIRGWVRKIVKGFLHTSFSGIVRDKLRKGLINIIISFNLTISSIFNYLIKSY